MSTTKLHPSRMMSVLSRDPKRARTDMGFCIMPSEESVLLCLSLQLFNTTAAEVGRWLGTSQQRVSQWQTGREPMAPFRRKQFLEIMQRRVNMMQIQIFGEGQRRDIPPDVFVHEGAAQAILTLMDTVMHEEERRLIESEKWAPN